VGLYGVGGGYLCAMMWWERIWGVRVASFGGGGGGGRWPFAECEARRGVFRIGSVWGNAGDGYVVYTKCWCYEE